MMTSPSPKREIPNRPVSTPVNTPVNTIEWSNGAVSLIDQTRLPSAEVVLEVRDYRQLIEAIESLRVRGAPALGVAAAYGIALGAQSLDVADAADFLARLDGIAREIVAARAGVWNPVPGRARPHFFPSGCRVGGQSTGMSTSVKLPGVAAFTAATTSATCGSRAGHC